MSTPTIDIATYISHLPKADLHVHVDGSMRITTFIELAQKYKVAIPAYTVEGLHTTLFKENYASLAEFLQGFLYIGQLLQHPEDLERISYELAMDCNQENVKYIEPIIAVHLHSNKQMTDKDVIVAMDKGLAKAKKEINANLKPDEIPFEYGIAIGTLRFYNEHFSDYYNRIISCFQDFEPKDIYALSALQAAKLLIHLTHNTNVQVACFEIGGAEDGFPITWFKEAYELLKKNLISIKAHAGEADGPDSIGNAIGECYAERIGHGLYLYSPEKIKGDQIKDKKEYVNRLVQYIAHKRITLEVSLTSNSQTAPEFKSLTNHPIRKMLNDKISVSLTTDNRLVCRTCMTKEYEKAVTLCGVSLNEIADIAYEGFLKSFFPHPYAEKVEYLQKVRKAIDQVKAKYGVK